MRNAALLTIVFLGVLSRLLPHAPNLTALTAVALFAGTYIRPARLAFVAPLAVMLISDFVLGFHNVMFFVYGAWALIAALAMLMKGENENSPSRLLALSLSGSVLFFLISNFGVWLLDGMYAKTVEGFVACYLMALPFLKNQVLGDLVYTVVFFTAWHFLQSRVPQLSEQKKI